jgi:hypothetical protein
MTLLFIVIYFMKMNFVWAREKRKHSLDVQIAREDEFSGRLSNRANFRSILLAIFPFFCLLDLDLKKKYSGCEAVLGISSILERIRICGFVLLTNGCGSNSRSGSFLQ